MRKQQQSDRDYLSWFAQEAFDSEADKAEMNTLFKGLEGLYWQANRDFLKGKLEERDIKLISIQRSLEALTSKWEAVIPSRPDISLEVKIFIGKLEWLAEKVFDLSKKGMDDIPKEKSINSKLADQLRRLS
jgi:hypothetical protein